MCTLIVLHRCVPGAPLVVAANRDEYFDRSAAGPAILSSSGDLPLPSGTRILAPRDLHAGGTWLGLSENRVFAALTNRPNPTPDPTRRSRGLLVIDALGYEGAAKAAAAFESLRPDQYNPFNLFVADERDAFTVVCNDGRVEVERLAAGIHVIGNADPNDLEHEKTRRTLEAANAVVKDAKDAKDAKDQKASLLEGLGELCRSHAGNDGPMGPLGATCVHIEPAAEPGAENPITAGKGYGTRSSILLRLNEDLEQSQFHYADGAPCAHPYEDSTPLLHALSRTASDTAAGS